MTTASWIEIDKEALEHNILNYKSIIKPALLAPVIKSNAYGHGVELIAKICDQNDLVNMLCVVSLKEARALRLINITKPIVVLSIIDDNLKYIITHDIDVVAYDIAFIYELNNIGKRLNKKAKIHIKVDSGLSRLGLYHQDILTLIKQTQELPFIVINGIFTHFAESENADQTFTNYQIEQFNTLIQQLDAMKISIPFKHMACSAATSGNTNSRYNLVRVGIGTYGLWSSPDSKQITLQQYPQFSLKPVLTWKTKIIQIKDILAGSFVGYDRTYQVQNLTRIAIIPVGYWDGYDRRLSNKGRVVINNQQAPIIGRIAMNLSIIDITGLDVSINHDVTLLGNHQGLTADDIATICQTINYEIVTRINPLLPRLLKPI